MKGKCDVCGKNTYTKSGWHLEGNLDFCGNSCVAKFIEQTMRIFRDRIKDQEIRISKLEKMVKT